MYDSVENSLKIFEFKMKFRGLEMFLLIFSTLKP